MDVDSTGNVYVADHHNHRLQKFAPGVPGWRQVNINGFGDRQTGRVMTLASYAGQLYAGTHNEQTGAQLWRQSANNSWTAVFTNGFGSTYNSGIVHLVEFDGQFYASTQADSINGGEIWRSMNGQNWSRVVSQGFGDPTNGGIFRLGSINNQLYAGTWSYTSTHGLEIWRSSTGNAGDWGRVVPNGFGDANNSNALSFEVLNGYLYVGTWNDATGGELWRTSNGTAWSQVNSDGFGTGANLAVMSLASLKGYLHAGTSNWSNGGQVWRCQVCDGSDWNRVVTNGFGSPNSGSVDALLVFDNAVYAIVANETTGFEVWRTEDGAVWTQVSGGGLGDSNTIAPWADNSVVVFNNSLWIGTQNYASGGKIWQLLRSLYLPLIQR